jgi:hypothetical protein
VNVNPAVLWTGKYVGAAVFVAIAMAVIYLGGVISVYVLAWVVELIGIIFT